MKLQIIKTKHEKIDITSITDSPYIHYENTGITYELIPPIGMQYKLTIFVPKEASIEEKLSEIFNQKVEVIGL